MSLLGRTPRTVLGALVTGVLDPESAARIGCAIRTREAGSLRDPTTRVQPDGDGEAPNHPLVERGPSTPTPHPAA